MGIESDSEAFRLAADGGGRMKAALIALKDDHEALDRDYFIALSPAAKMAMVATMFTEQWLLKGGNADQLRLRRDIARLERRGRLNISLSERAKDIADLESLEHDA